MIDLFLVFNPDLIWFDPNPLDRAFYTSRDAIAYLETLSTNAIILRIDCETP